MVTHQVIPETSHVFTEPQEIIQAQPEYVPVQEVVSSPQFYASGQPEFYTSSQPEFYTSGQPHFYSQQPHFYPSPEFYTNPTEFVETGPEVVESSVVLKSRPQGFFPYPMHHYWQPSVVESTANVGEGHIDIGEHIVEPQPQVVELLQSSRPIHAQLVEGTLPAHVVRTRVPVHVSMVREGMKKPVHVDMVREAVKEPISVEVIQQQRPIQVCLKLNRTLEGVKLDFLLCIM